MTNHMEIERLIGQYLGKVAAQMGEVAPDEKDSILREVESHIYAALEKRGGAKATSADLDVVLAEMAPPGSYAAAATEAKSGQGGPGSPAVYPLAKKGAVLFAVAMGLWGLAALPLVLSETGIEPFDALGFLFSTAMIIAAIVVSVVAVAVGFTAIAHIKASHGQLYGMPLAFMAAFGVPILGVALVLFWAQTLIEEEIPRGHLGLFQPFCIISTLAITVWLFVRAWRWTNRIPGARANVAAPDPSERTFDKPSFPRLCKQPIVAAFWAPFVLAALPIATPVHAGAPPPSIWYKILTMGILFPLGVAAPFATTALGLIGISRIRSSKGSHIGMPLAVTASLFYPTVVFNVAVWYASQAVASVAFETDKIANLFVVVMLTIAAIMSVFVFVKILSWATRPAKEGEFT